MKRILHFKILHFLLILVLGLSQACKGPEGDPGPKGDPGTPGATGAQGPAGPAGPAGTPATADVYDITGFNFTAANNFRATLDYEANEIEVGEDDVVFVYELAGVAQDNSGNNIPFWSPLPQTYTVNGNSFTYSFAYSNVALLILMQGATSVLSGLPAEYTTNQIYRVVVAPGIARGGRKAGPTVDFNNYNEVAKHFGINEEQIKKITIK